MVQNFYKISSRSPQYPSGYLHLHMKTKLKRELMPNRIKKAKKDLVKLSHDWVRHRDSKTENNASGQFIGGYCFDCGNFTVGSQFQSGHWIPDSTGGVTLRYHPHNMHGQAGACNCGYNQEMVKIHYTQAMVRKYGQERVDELLALKNKTIKADIIWYGKMIELYSKPYSPENELDILLFLEG